MANLITNSEKSRGNNAVALLLPFERYVQSITNLEERKRLCDTCKQAIGIRSDTLLLSEISDNKIEYLQHYHSIES